MHNEDQDLIKLQDYAIKTYASVYVEAKAYANVILTASYASFFAIWSFTKIYLPEKATILIALLMCISAVVFVIFESIKIVFLGRQILSSNNLLHKYENVQELTNFFKQNKNSEYRDSLIMARIWYIFFSASFSFGMAAGALLLYNFVANLAHLPYWPT